MLSIDDILKANDREIRKITCPEWSGDVYIRSLTADERDQLDKQFQAGLVGNRAAMVAVSLCDEQGKSLNVTPAQAKALGTKAGAPMERLVDTILEINGMRPEDIEEMRKNSMATGDGS